MNTYYFLTAAALLLSSLLFAEAAEIVTLTDIKGRTISATIVEVTDKKVMLKKDLEAKVIEINRAILDQESIDKITIWEKTQLAKPQLVESHTFKIFDDKTVQIKLPKGSYVVKGGKDYIEVKFDNNINSSVGALMIVFREIKGANSYFKNLTELKKGGLQQLRNKFGRRDGPI